jgi:hypothetical protein
MKGINNVNVPKFNFGRKKIKTSGADIDSEYNLLVAKICTRLNRIIKIQKGKRRWDLEKLYVQRQKVQDFLDEKLGAAECLSGNFEVQWNNIKKWY